MISGKGCMNFMRSLKKRQETFKISKERKREIVRKLFPRSGESREVDVVRGCGEG